MTGRILHTHRQTVFLVERAKVFVDDGRVLYQVAEGGISKRFNIPFANLSVLFLGQGTSLTSEAARLLSSEGVYVAFTGSGGSPLHYGALTNFQVTQHLQAMISVYQDKGLSLRAAQRIMDARVANLELLPSKIGKGRAARVRPQDIRRVSGPFSKKVAGAQSAETLMGIEGQFAKAIYATFSRACGVSGFKRQAGAGKADSLTGQINSRIDHGNYIAYGIAGAVLWTLGIPASLSVLHGKTRAGGLVFDLADSFKDAVVLPLAFSAFETEQEFRASLISAIQDQQIMSKAFELMKDILSLPEQQ